MIQKRAPRREFIFVSCQPGAEPALKLEITREHPDFKFAFSRPGFVTFRSDVELDPRFELHSVFARAYGLSLSDIKGKSEEARVQAALDQASMVGGPLRLHVWERDRQEPGEERTVPDQGFFASAAEDAIRAKAGSILFMPPGPPEPGEQVFDVIILEGEHWWFGYHEHTAAHSLDPGGDPGIELPPKAPSRAYLKLEEGVRWARLPLSKGEVALEIGSAPGGASYALLERGLDVIGVDPASMDPAVLPFGPGRFRHLKRGIAHVLPEDFTGPVHWLLLDMNVPPQIALDALETILTWPIVRENLLGVLLTLKLNRWRIAAEIPQFLGQIRAAGIARVRATQLPSNRQEFFVAGLTRKGLAKST